MNSSIDLHKTLLDNLLLTSHFFFNFKINIISSTHLISIPSGDHVHCFQCLWIQKVFEKKRRTLSQNTVKTTLMNQSLSGGKICPMHMNIKSPRYKNCKTAMLL